jgi:hypothetical protein
MAIYRTRQDYDYDYDLASHSSSERDLAVQNLVLSDDLHHNSRSLAAENALALRRDLSSERVHRSSSYNRHDGRALNHAPIRQEAGAVSLSEAVRRFAPSTSRPRPLAQD